MSGEAEHAQDPVPAWTFGDRVRKARRHAGLSQGALAARLGVGASVVSNWESGANKPRDLVETAERISAETHVPTWWLLDLAGMTRSSYYAFFPLDVLHGDEQPPLFDPDDPTATWASGADLALVD